MIEEIIWQMEQIQNNNEIPVEARVSALKAITALLEIEICLMDNNIDLRLVTLVKD